MRKTLLVGLVIVGAAVLGTAAFLLSRAPSGQPSPAAPALPATASTTVPGGVAAKADQKPTAVKTTKQQAAVAQAAPVWTVDKAASRLSFRGVMNGVPFDGVFRDWDAQIAFDPKNLATSRASITVDTSSALTGEPLKDQALPNSEWLDVDQFPLATLVTRSITQVGPGRYQAAADIHVRGVRWRTTVPFTVSINHDEGKVEATLTLDRRTFGIGEGPFQSPAPVEPDVQVTLKLAAKKGR